MASTSDDFFRSASFKSVKKPLQATDVVKPPTFQFVPSSPNTEAVCGDEMEVEPGLTAAAASAASAEDSDSSNETIDSTKSKKPISKHIRWISRWIPKRLAIRKKSSTQAPKQSPAKPFTTKATTNDIDIDDEPLRSKHSTTPNRNRQPATVNPYYHSPSHYSMPTTSPSHYGYYQPNTSSYPMHYQQQQQQQQHKPVTDYLPSGESLKQLPQLLGGYIQLMFNIAVLLIICYLAYGFLQSVNRDIDNKVEEMSAEILKEISMCSKHFMDNRCDSSDRVPALEEACRSWQNCMRRDPAQVARTKLSAETLAEVINGFVEPLSYKTMIFFIVILFSFLLLSNLAFHFARGSKHIFGSSASDSSTSKKKLKRSSINNDNDTSSGIAGAPPTQFLSDASFSAPAYPPPSPVPHIGYPYSAPYMSLSPAPLPPHHYQQQQHMPYGFQTPPTASTRRGLFETRSLQGELYTAGADSSRSGQFRDDADADDDEADNEVLRGSRLFQRSPQTNALKRRGFRM